MVDVEQWAEIRRMRRVEGLSGREISRRTGLHRDTVARLSAALEPPKYQRKAAGSKLDPFKDWICVQLAADPRIESQRLRELAGEIGYEGGERASMIVTSNKPFSAWGDLRATTWPPPR